MRRKVILHKLNSHIFKQHHLSDSVGCVAFYVCIIRHMSSDCESTWPAAVTSKDALAATIKGATFICVIYRLARSAVHM